jgi:hypothetical protein
MECPGSVGLMLRKTFPDLERSLIRKSKKYYLGYAEYSESRRAWRFPNGSIQEFGYLDKDSDVEQFQSAEYDDIEFDELTHFSEYQYTYMRSRLRSSSGGKWKTQIRAASNPGSRGHAWVKARFVDPARDKLAEYYDEELDETKTRYFLTATLDDNTLMSPQKRAEYRSWLKGLNESERKMLLEGDWDYVPGAAFAEWNHKIHVIKPIPIPQDARIYMSYDFGFGKPFSVGWWWADYDSRLYRFNEWYGWNGKADTGLRLAPSDQAKGILSREKIMGIKQVHDRIADPSIFAKTANYKGGGLGKSIAEMMSDEGVYFNPGDNDRLLGKAQFHERLKYDEDKVGTEEFVAPMVQFYDTCQY